MHACMHIHRRAPGRASPKSQILSLQSELARMFLGFCSAGSEGCRLKLRGKLREN